MYKILCTTLAIIALSATLPLTAPAQTLSSSDAGAIAKQLKRYELTLNAADIDGIMELYAENAVFMPQHSLPVVGRDAVRIAYRHFSLARSVWIWESVNSWRSLDRMAAAKVHC